MGEEIRYTLGLAIGVNYVGWSVLNLDKKRIEDLGVRSFDAAENPKTGASLALPRRLFRGRRRLLRRKSYRVERVRKMLIQYNILTRAEMDTLYSPVKGRSIWEIRGKGLDEPVTAEEWARLLISFAKRRGFKSNRKSELKDKELGALLKSISANISRLEESKYRTFGEMLYKESVTSNDPSFALRNKNGDYTNGILRTEIEKEIRLLFAAQRSFGAEFASEEIENKYIEIFNSQRPYSDFETLENFVGYCTFEKNNKLKRAPKSSISSEEFTMYRDINKLSILNEGDKRPLTNEEKELITKSAYNKDVIKYSDLRKILNLSEGDRFSTLTYSEDKDISKTEGAKFISLRGYHEIRKAVSKNIGKDYWEHLKEDRDTLNNLAYVLTLAKTDEQIISNLKSRNIEDDLIAAVMDLSFTKFNNLSIEAIEKILPFLKSGYTYSDACALAGYDIKTIYKGGRSKKLPIIEIDEIVNPVLGRALSQARKVINAVIDMYGSPESIHIELAKNIDRNKSDRNKSERFQKENKVEKNKAKEELKVIMGIDKEPTGTEVLKYRLWKNQNEECAYSQEKISLSDLFKPGNYEVDHILPLSRTFDDTINNKILVKAYENRKKGNKTPYEYFGGDKDRWEEFVNWVDNSEISYAKKSNLLRKRLSSEEERGFRQRNIQDNRYIVKYISSFISEKLEFSPSINRKVVFINPQATSYIKVRWGLNVVPEDDRYHALDASIVAAINKDIINKISLYNKAYELKYLEELTEEVDVETGEIITSDKLDRLRKENFPTVWPEFKSEVILRMCKDPIQELSNNPIKSYDEEFIEKKLRPIFVSRMPKRKISGQLFEETIYPVNSVSDGKYIFKKKLIDLKEEDFENIYNYNSDKKLYEAIYNRFLECDKDAKKAFGENPFRKPTKSGKLGPVVNSIKIASNRVPAKDYITFDNKPGNFKRGDMARIDLYEKEGKYYIVPVYSYQILNNITPKKASTAGKNESEWTVIDDTYTFKMSLFKNDLIKISYKNRPGYFGYYINFDRSTSSLKIEEHDSSAMYKGIGIKSAVESIEKFNVDVLGYYTIIKQKNK
ncbi:type II CRISPR RNA-guided endonuclease Cas9 [Clostridium sp.]|uniref:type II CRISPR RNA-guided endonuclease Cas9 n=1 Tax=Clostridium sp. TaxID=1506 RepID=UPI001B6A7135|nr:type II CRISPR RNA-guided endonuclease Cas9 [Clostridium sp.]MBP3917218.1 type II CRISPR RNA-guided endonuclease Cas9 [Clostridium sp.]